MYFCFEVVFFQLFSLCVGTHASSFVLPNPHSQPLVIKTARVFDSEGSPADTNLDFQVSVSDGTNSVTSSNIQLSVNNINDNPVVCSVRDYYVTVTEDAAAGKDISFC